MCGGEGGGEDGGVDLADGGGGEGDAVEGEEGVGPGWAEGGCEDFLFWGVGCEVMWVCESGGRGVGRTSICQSGM